MIIDDVPGGKQYDAGGTQQGGGADGVAVPLDAVEIAAEDGRACF